MVVTSNTYIDSLSLRARIVTTCHFVPKILTIKEYFFLDPSVYHTSDLLVADIILLYMNNNLRPIHDYHSVFHRKYIYLRAASVPSLSCLTSSIPTKSNLYFKSSFATVISNLKVGCLHPVACTRSGSGFPSNATLVWIFYLVTIFRKLVIRPKHVAVTK
jgi:hypothetical protein